jgi:hypothetical protein
MSEKRLRIMTEKRNANKEWVALSTFSDEDRGMFYETGGIYSHEPYCRGMAGARELVPGEYEVACPRCGQRFATVDEGAAEGNRDLHFNGDEDIPSICAPKNATDD